jgi:hypothetical protein
MIRIPGIALALLAALLTGCAGSPWAAVGRTGDHLLAGAVKAYQGTVGSFSLATYDITPTGITGGVIVFNNRPPIPSPAPLVTGTLSGH